MRTNTLVIFFLFCFLVDAAAQKHDYIWPFGYLNSPSNPPNSPYGGAYIDFNQVPTAGVKNNRVLNFGLAGSACSDSSGKLLFYTNGLAIHNHLDKLIENGDTINPGYWWDSAGNYGYSNGMGSFPLPYPGHPNTYVYFHTGVIFDVDSSYVRHSPLYYTIIDMNANGGEGKVIQKNQILLEGDLGWPAACKHGNGRDWWITLYKPNHPEQITFLLSQSGISGPIVQSIGPALYPEFYGKCLFSPDGRTYVRHDGNNGPRLMNFDRCTGLFSNLRILAYPDEIYSWSAAFSPNSRYLYLSKPSLVTRIDLLANNINTSFDTLGRYNLSHCATDPSETRVFQMQEGPDGKIYCSSDGDSRCITRIEQPLLPGLAADLYYGGFDLPRSHLYTICHFPNYRLGEWEGALCDTINFQQPGDGFYASRYTPSEANAEKSLLSEPYKIFPVACEPNEAARKEKNELGDMRKLEYNLWLNRKDAIETKSRPYSKTHTKNE